MKEFFLSIVFLLFFPFFGQEVCAQTVFATETFGTGAAQGTLANGFVGDMGTWTVVNTGANGASSNNWYVSGEECGNAVGVCGSACPGGDNSLHVSAIGGLCGVPDCGAAYDETGPVNQTNQRAESPVIDCLGKGNISLNFNYIAAQADDDFTIEYSPDGVVWSTLATPAASLCCDCNDAFLCAFLFICCGGPPLVCTGLEQGLWTAYTIPLPMSADNNPNVQIAFNWSNDGNGIGTDPSVAIDDITITHDIILPVDLISFNASELESGIELSWTTKSELNCDFFVLEHSTDGRFFYPVNTIDGQGTSSEHNDYKVLHEVEEKQNYYRLKQVDLDGNYEYSQVIQIERTSSTIIVFQEGNEIVVTGLEGDQGQIQLTDQTGRHIGGIYPYESWENEIRFQLDAPLSGIHFLIIQHSKGRKVIKFLPG